MAERSTCLRRKFGSIIVKNDVIVSTGYNGAPREQMLGATLYMVCVSPEDGTILPGTTSCMMCKRVIINAGIEKVIIRDDKENYRIVEVKDWVEDDDSLSGQMGY